MTATFALICALLAATVSGAVESRGASLPGADQSAGSVVTSARDPLNGRTKSLSAASLNRFVVPTENPGAETAGSGAPLTLAGGTTYSGNLAWASPSFGPRYLAVREPVGTLVEACGPAGCVTRRSTDFGPVLSLWRAGRIADLSAADWQTVCGVPLRFGLCPGSIQVLSRRPATPLPATDEETP